MHATRLARALGATGLLLTAACEVVAPPLPETALTLVPPPVYSTWWRMVEHCAGRTGSLHAITWYEVPGVAEVEVNGRLAAGYWSRAGNRIVLAGQHVRNGALVRHEMLHALLGGGGHPRGQFLGACAGVVSCSRECVEGVFTPPAGAELVSSNVLQLTAELTPGAPSLDVDGGFFAVVVGVRNPLDVPVRVVPIGTQAQVSGFGFEVRSATWGTTVQRRSITDGSTLAFAPGETKRWVFDFNIREPGTSDGLPPGPYTVTGWFDRAQSPAVQFRIPQ